MYVCIRCTFERVGTCAIQAGPAGERRRPLGLDLRTAAAPTGRAESGQVPGGAVAPARSHRLRRVRRALPLHAGQRRAAQPRHRRDANRAPVRTCASLHH